MTYYRKEINRIRTECYSNKGQLDTVIIETKRYEMPEQKISSVIEIEKAEFYVGDEEPHNGNLSPDLKSNSPIRIILQTKNADELFEKALKLGATEICPMTTEDDWRIGKLKDPFGHIWEIGCTLQ
jgi:PhnB protein